MRLWGDDVSERQTAMLLTSCAVCVYVPSCPLCCSSLACERRMCAAARSPVSSADPSCVLKLPLRQDGEPLSIEGMPVESALTRFLWDEAKYPVRSHLRETVEKISTHISKMEDALKGRAADYNGLKGQLTQLSRRAQGSLLVRDLAQIVTQEHVVESENLTTLIVVVNKYSQQEWIDCYETLSQFVVPRSTKKLIEEGDYALYTVVVFRRVADEFRSEARAKGFQVRDYTHDPEATVTRETEEGALREGVSTKEQALLVWCRTSYVEAFTSWVHLSAVRVFSESIMRFGLPPQFLAALVRPQPKMDKRLRTALSALFAGRDAHHWTAAEDTAAMGVGALSAEDLHPYVSLTLNIVGTGA